VCKAVRKKFGDDASHRWGENASGNGEETSLKTDFQSRLHGEKRKKREKSGLRKAEDGCLENWADLPNRPSDRKDIKAHSSEIRIALGCRRGRSRNAPRRGEGRGRAGGGSSRKKRRSRDWGRMRDPYSRSEFSTERKNRLTPSKEHLER